MGTVYDTLSAQNTTNTESIIYHRVLTYTVEISASEHRSDRDSERRSAGGLKCSLARSLRCSLTDLSHQGFMVEPAIPFPGRSAENDRAEFQNFFKTICPEGRIHSKPLHTSIIIKEQEPIALSSRVAFVEKGADESFKRAGLNFADSDKQQKNRLVELLKQVG